ncbi:MAG: transposase [Omnitrophica bacterium]|nr:transposase [Candidatus Omnitrophota bacterium]
MINTFTPRKPKRLKTHDYLQQGYYHITICTHNHQEAFGTIKNNSMILNEYGHIANNTWIDLPNHHKNIKLDEYIIMPNHIHAIINVVVGAGPARPFTKYKNSNNMSIIIGSYKSSVTRQINKLNNNKFRWQRSFHDYIIRSSNHSLYNIRKYIINNPANWDADENNIKNYKLKGRAGPAPTATFDKI